MFSLLVAFYFMCLVPSQEHPLVVGPYSTWDECASVREFLNARGYETGGCSVMPFPQDQSITLNVGDIPHDH